VTVYLVRHAQALSRHDWRQPDDIRPLSPKGDRQANGLVEVLGAEPVMRVLSSPAVRCQATVAPLAHKLGLDVEVFDDLLEGASAARALRVMEVAASNGHDAVVCSHGDVIPDVLRHLAAEGVKILDPLKWAKGSTWALETEGGRFRRARYLPPSA
jgi:8-oxo-dGTP diphosphatase